MCIFCVTSTFIFIILFKNLVQFIGTVEPEMDTLTNFQFNPILKTMAEGEEGGSLVFVKPKASSLPPRQRRRSHLRLIRSPDSTSRLCHGHDGKQEHQCQIGEFLFPETHVLWIYLWNNLLLCKIWSAIAWSALMLWLSFASIVIALNNIIFLCPAMFAIMGSLLRRFCSFSLGWTKSYIFFTLFKFCWVKAGILVFSCQFINYSLIQPLNFISFIRSLKVKNIWQRTRD